MKARSMLELFKAKKWFDTNLAPHGENFDNMDGERIFGLLTEWSDGPNVTENERATKMALLARVLICQGRKVGTESWSSKSACGLDMVRRRMM